MSRASPENRPPVGIAILAKAPVAGFAKTRLIPALGAAGAAALQDWLLRHAVRQALAADIGPVTLWCAPDPDHPAFTRCRQLGAVDLCTQPESDLGERMRHAIAESPTRAGTLVIGTDCPGLTPAILRNAATALADHDATVIPAEDGGYVLIGMQSAATEVFTDITWSSDQVMIQTRQRLASNGWRWREFDPLWDVDRDSDLPRLYQHFPESQCPSEPS
jgi:uncharacterized protein